MANRYRTDPQHLLRVVLIDEGQIEIPKIVGDSFEVTDFHLF